MFKNLRTLSVVSITYSCLLTACSTTNGKIINIKNDNVVDISYREGFIENGDGVAFFKTECNREFPIRGRRCWDYRLGGGKVILTSGNVATVKAEESVALSSDVWAERAIIKRY